MPDHEAKGHRMESSRWIADFKPTPDDPENVRCVLVVQQFSQQNLGVAGRFQCRFRNPRNLKTRELAFCEVSGRTFSGTVNRNHASEAKFSSRSVANSLSRDVFESSVV